LFLLNAKYKTAVAATVLSSPATLAPPAVGATVIGGIKKILAIALVRFFFNRFQ